MDELDTMENICKNCEHWILIKPGKYDEPKPFEFGECAAQDGPGYGVRTPESDKGFIGTMDVNGHSGGEVITGECFGCVLFMTALDDTQTLCLSCHGSKTTIRSNDKGGVPSEGLKYWSEPCATCSGKGYLEKSEV